MSEVDLSAYFERIGYSGRPRPDSETLQALQFAHVTAVPFENLDIQMGLPISLGLDALQDKIVRRRRGGYCFEQNTLFEQVLRQIGFEVEAFEAQVRVARPDGPRTHMLLHVRSGGQSYITDVGFGNSAPLRPLRLSASPQQQSGQTYRIAREGRDRILQIWRRGAWMDLYAFVPYPRLPADFEMGNHFTSTHESSGFVQSVVVQLLRPDERLVLRNLSYQVWRGEGVADEQTLTREELLPVLRERFGLELPADARFRALS